MTKSLRFSIILDCLLFLISIFDDLLPLIRLYSILIFFVFLIDSFVSFIKFLSKQAHIVKLFLDIKRIVFVLSCLRRDRWGNTSFHRLLSHFFSKNLFLQVHLDFILIRWLSVCINPIPLPDAFSA